MMSEPITIIFVILLFSINMALIRAQCNLCASATQMACVSETQYQACVNNIPSGTVNSCPSNFICSTLTSIICQSTTSGIPATCNECNVCNADMTFACTGVSTYALCLGTTVPSSSTGICSGSLVCDINLAQICGDPTTGVVPTCSTVENAVTTTQLPLVTSAPPTLQTYAQVLCQYTRVNGRFSLPNQLDTSCKNYIYCFLTNNGTWSGQFYTCAGSTYFDSFSRYCVASRPSGC